jgi:hypothetical protein
VKLERIAYLETPLAGELDLAATAVRVFEYHLWHRVRIDRKRESLRRCEVSAVFDEVY